MVTQIQPRSVRRLADTSGSTYEVLGRLATGGMAELFLARTGAQGHGSGAVVVLKRILPHLAADPEFIRMFRDEAQLALVLRHPNIVRTLAIGENEDFFTMEYVHGETLRALFEAAQGRGENIPLPQVLSIALAIARGLHHTHQQRDLQGRPLHIVHRDVSPTNVIVGYDGAVKLVDFGVAKAAAGAHVTQAGTLKGKLSYMSPEQCRAEPVDHRSDVFALGILLYEATTLTRLFAGENEVAVLHRVISGAVEPPSSRRRGYPPALERIVMRALRTDPGDRHASAEELGLDLARFAQHIGVRPSDDALARYLRGLFGDKPLPWSTDHAAVESIIKDDQTVELDHAEQHTEVAPAPSEARQETTQVAEAPPTSAASPSSLAPPAARRPKAPLFVTAGLLAAVGVGLGASALGADEPEPAPGPTIWPEPEPEPDATPPRAPGPESEPEPEPGPQPKIVVPPEFRRPPELLSDPEFVLTAIVGEGREREAVIKLRNGTTIRATMGASVGDFRVVAINPSSVLLEQRDAQQQTQTRRLEL